MSPTRKTPVLKPGTLIFEVSEGLLQVGSSPNQSVLLSSLTKEEVKWLKALRTRRARVKNLSQREEEMLRLLDAGNLTDDGANPLEHLRVRIVGLDRVGTRVAHMLARAGVHSLELVDRTLVDEEVEDLYPRSALGRARQSELRRAIKGQRPNFLIQKLARPDLVILSSSRVWDPGLTGALLSEDINYLPVVREQGSVTVGPLVAPGVTACTTCLDLYVQESIPSWPKMALELASCAPISTPDYMCATAAGLTVAMIEAVAQGRPPVEGGEPIGRLGGPSYSWRVTRLGVAAEGWQAHPNCTCLTGPLEAHGAA